VASGSTFSVLLLADTPGWIVDRVCQRMQAAIPEIARVEYYVRIDANGLRRRSREFDLIHYGNWDCGHLAAAFADLACPLVMSVRSHRFPPELRATARLATVVHAITPALQTEFPGSVYIPNGIFDPEPDGADFVVGFAGRPDDYKGFGLIAAACERAGAVFRPATGDVPPHGMRDYYRSIDVYVCASVAEGHSTPVLECLALNRPVISTRVGLPTVLPPTPQLTFVDRDVESIAAAIRARMTRAQVLPRYSWAHVCAELRRLYAAVVSSGRLPADWVGRWDADLPAVDSRPARSTTG
jgi:glycosyltransferase involved in cell wall biosynthesis